MKKSLRSKIAFVWSTAAFVGVASLTSIGCGIVPLPVGGVSSHAPAAAVPSAPKVAAAAAGANCPAPTADAGKNAGASERGFTPVTSEELLSSAHDNKTLFIGVTMEGNVSDTWNQEWSRERPREYIWAGDPVTVCHVESSTTRMSGPKGTATYKTANVVFVKTLDGERRVVEARMLSSKPLFYGLRTPGPADQFVRNLFNEGFGDGKALQDKVEAGHYELEGYVGTGDSAKVSELYRQREAYELVVKEVAHHLDPMSRGHRDRASILRMPDTAWITKAEDQNVLEWQVDGPPKTSRPTYEGMAGCVRGVVNTIAVQLSYHFKMKEIDDKQWRQGMQNASAQQVEALDKAEIARRQKAADGYLKYMSDSFTAKGCKEGLRYTASK
jgi:hypothetical protein